MRKKQKVKATKKQQVNPLLDLYVGTNQTGKSTIAAKVAATVPRLKVFSNNWPYVRATTNQVFVHHYPGADIAENQKLLLAEFQRSVNCLFVIDDARQWLTSGRGQMSGSLRYLFAERRPRNIDLIIISHGFGDFSADLLDFNPRFVLFNFTGIFPKRLVSDSEQYARFKAAIDNVKKQAKTDPYTWSIYRF